MNKEELAANLFRITQTEAKIRLSNVRGQARLEAVAADAGAVVRRSMMQISGTRPENIPAAEDIRKVRSALKQTGKEYAKLDAPKPPAKRGRAKPVGT